MPTTLLGGLTLKPARKLDITSIASNNKKGRGMNEFAARFRQLKCESDDETIQRLTNDSEPTTMCESVAHEVQDD